MQTLRIYLLGNVELHLGSKRLGGFATKKSKALFAYLVLGKGKLFSREQLADVFWGDLPESRARRALSTDLWRIGNLLKDGGADPDAYLISDSDAVGFNMDAPHWVDVERFEAATSRIDRIDPATADQTLIGSTAGLETWLVEAFDGALYNQLLGVHVEEVRRDYARLRELIDTLNGYVAEEASPPREASPHEILARELSPEAEVAEEDD